MATYDYEQSFDALTNNTGLAGQDSWTQTVGNTYPRVNSAQAFDGTQSVIVTYVSDPPDAHTQVDRSITSCTSGRLYTAFRPNAGFSPGNYLYVYLTGEDNASIYFGIVDDGSSNKIVVGGEELGTAAINNWYVFEIEWGIRRRGDVYRGRFRLSTSDKWSNYSSWIDTGVGYGSNTTTINNIRIKGLFNGGDSCCLDAISIESPLSDVEPRRTSAVNFQNPAII